MSSEKKKKRTNEYNKGAHNARFDTDKDLMNCKMLRSQDFIYLVESKVEENEENEETASYGWWSMAGGMSVNHMSVLPTWKEFFSARLGRDMYLISQGQGESGRQKQL